MPQLAEDVALAARKIAPTYSYTTGAGYPRVSNIIAVYYTHLDVYKRQVYGRGAA